ncbi:MAG: DUF6497 family protein [Gemmobacter sp.]|nr:DUF6497 family protein [Gemmobacter sp.]
MRAAAVLVTLAGPALGLDLIEVPSGQPVTLQDVIWNQPGPAGLTARFRFIAPEIARDGGHIDFDTAAADMDHLCETYALPRVTTITGPRPAQVVISLSDIPVEFGVVTPEATQFFEAYSITEGVCEWEPF